MMVSRKTADPRANRLLGLLSLRDYERLRPHLRPITLKYRQSLYDSRGGQGQLGCYVKLEPKPLGQTITWLKISTKLNALRSS